MSTNHTSKYALSQWLHTDPVLMDDFNEDNRKLDAALAAKAEVSALSALSSQVADLPRIAAGSYVGTGEGGYTRTLNFTMSLGRPPQAVFVRPKTSSNRGLTLLRGAARAGSNGDRSPFATDYVEVTWSQNSVSWKGTEAEGSLNSPDATYLYFAIG